MGLIACAPAKRAEDEDGDDGPTLRPVLLMPESLGDPATIGFILAGHTTAAPAQSVGLEKSGEAVQAPAPFLRVEDQALVIERMMLNQPLLLLPALVEERTTPHPLLWHYTNMVYFQQLHDTMLLIERQGGQRPETTNLSGTILATFPILGESAQEIRFDFQQGALAELIHDSPILEPTATAVNAGLVAGREESRLTGGYIRSSITEADWTSFEQVLGFRGTPERGAVIRYTFWRADRSTLPPLEDDPLDAIGYFNSRTFTPGATTPRFTARRWDLRKPLTFYLSNNTPLRFREAIREGALAWNAVLGPDMLAVADAPPGVTAGDPRYPLIQWVEDERGYGIGMSQGDPVTGEALTALIIVTQGWADLRYTDRLEAARNAGITLAGADAAPLCEYHQTGWTGPWGPTAAETVLLTEEQRQVVAKQQLRAVIMHEVGHVLGLRHNFAASLDTAIPPEENLADLQGAIRGERPPDAPLPSSSIMDYLTTADMIRMTTPGRYDAIAIAWGYHRATGETSPATAAAEAFHFCTEALFDRYGDCAPYDSGPEPLLWWSTELEEIAHGVSRWIATTVIPPHGEMPPPLFPSNNDAQIPTEILEWQRRMERAMERLIGYQTTEGWVINHHYPVERAAWAAQLLNTYFVGSPTRDLHEYLTAHPLLRQPLLTTIGQLSSLADSAGPGAPWAAQVLHTIATALQLVSLPTP